MDFPSKTGEEFTAFITKEFQRIPVRTQQKIAISFNGRTYKAQVLGLETAGSIANDFSKPLGFIASDTKIEYKASKRGIGSQIPTKNSQKKLPQKIPQNSLF